MAEGECEHCKEHFKNLPAHKRFCKKNPANIKPVEKEEPEATEDPLSPPPGELEPEDIQEPEEPPQDHMFRVEFQHLDPFGYPYRSITQARLGDMAAAEQQARTQTDIVTLTMMTTPYGPCSIKIPKSDIDQGKRTLAPFTGKKIFQIKINGVEYYEILMMRSEIRKMYFNLHSIPTDGGYARYEDIQRNALMISPEGSPTAPPPIMYGSHYKNKKNTQALQNVAEGIEKD